VGHGARRRSGFIALYDLETVHADAFAGLVSLELLYGPGGAGAGMPAWTVH